MKQKFIQIGVTAARDPATGEFLPSEPIFAEITPELEAAEKAVYNDAGKLFAEKMKKYIDGGGLVKRRTARTRAKTTGNEDKHSRRCVNEPTADNN